MEVAMLRGMHAEKIQTHRKWATFMSVHGTLRSRVTKRQAFQPRDSADDEYINFLIGDCRHPKGYSAPNERQVIREQAFAGTVIKQE